MKQANDNSALHSSDPGRTRASLRRWTAGLAAVAVAAYLFSGLLTIGTDERGVLLRFGRVRGEPLLPGVHLTLPAGIDRVARIRLRRTRRITVGAGTGLRTVGALPTPEQSQFLTGDRNIVDLQASVQFVVDDPVAYLFRTTAPDALVRNAVEAALCEVVGAMTVDDVLTRRKAEVQNSARTAAQRLLQGYGAGVSLLSVSIERVGPPEAVADAFRDVVSARADSRRRKAEAEGYRDDLLARAAGEAAAIRRNGEADAYAIGQKARGRAQRFAATLSAAAQHPTLTRRRLRAQTLESLLPRTRLIIADPNAETDVRLVEEGQ
ncbi:MAG: FtsH protease activity modulator HflK [Kiritimatiellaeota bacterium]|nr:FtsH protease activity modulator HflK [Kiritimatiellota bacterium]